VGGGEDGVGFGELKEGVVEPDLELGEIERIVAQIDGLTAQVGGDAVAVVVEGEGSGLGDLAGSAMEEGLTQLCGVDGTGGGGRVLAETFEGSLAGFGVELGMVDDLDPGQERFVELAEGGDRGTRQLGQKVRLSELEETLNLTATFRVIGGTEDTLNAQASADSVELIGPVDAALVDVDGKGATVAQDGAFEAILHAGKLLVPVELGVRNEAGVIVEESEEKDLALAVGIGRVGEVGTVHGVALPQVAKVGTFEAAIGFGTLFGEELGGSGTTAGELAAQGTWGDAGFGNGVGGVEGEDADDRAGGAERLLPFEDLGAIEGFRGDGATVAVIGARCGFEAVEAALLVDALPASKGGGGDGAAGGIGDVIRAAGDLLAESVFAAGRILAADERQNEGIAKESNLGTSIWGHMEPPDVMLR
jgi:hypothetical protein